MAAPFDGHSGEEALYRLDILIFFYSDILLRLSAMALFMNAHLLWPWNWLTVLMVFGVHFGFECFESESWIDRLMGCFVSMFSNQSILQMIDSESDRNGDIDLVSRRRRLGHLVFDLVVSFVFSSCGLLSWNGLRDYSFVIGLALCFVLNVWTAVPAVEYMSHRSRLLQKWADRVISGDQCVCGFEQETVSYFRSESEYKRTNLVDPGMMFDVMQIADELEKEDVEMSANLSRRDE